MSAGFGPQRDLLPREGDLVVAFERQPVDRFTVRQHPAHPQLCTASRDEAIRQARAFAESHGVDLWFSEPGGFRLLESYRARPIVRPQRQAAAG